MLTINNIKSELSSITTEDLRSLNAAVVEELKFRNRLKLKRATSALYVGAICKVNKDGHIGKRYKVIKINPKNVVCEDLSTIYKYQWHITASLLEVIE